MLETTQFEVSVPNINPEKDWIVIETFNTKEEAINFCKKIWGIEDGMFCMISFVEPYWVIDTPNPNYESTNNKYLDVADGFYHQEDAISCAMENYGANEEGKVCLILPIEE